MVTFRSHCNNTPSTSADHAVAVLRHVNTTHAADRPFTPYLSLTCPISPDTTHAADPPLCPVFAQPSFTPYLSLLYPA